MSNQKPTAKFKGANGTEIALWLNSNNRGQWWSIKLQTPTKKNEAGEYVTNPFLNESDLPALRHLLDQAIAYLTQCRIAKQMPNFSPASKPAKETDAGADEFHPTDDAPF